MACTWLGGIATARSKSKCDNTLTHRGRMLNNTLSHCIIYSGSCDMSFAFFCCHLRYAGFGHINQKIAPHCSRGSSRKQFSHFLMWKLRGSAFCRNLSFCLLHVIYEHRDLIYTCCVFYDVRYFNKFYLCNSSSLPTCL